MDHVATRTAPVVGVDELIARLDAAVGDSCDANVITGRVKTALEDLAHRDALELSDEFYHVRGDSYARRLLYRDPAMRYTAVVMTWGPDQKTPLHDHAGIWCVECVVHGSMEVRQFDLTGEANGEYSFRPMNTIRAEVGAAGCLIPPFEYHVLGNARPDEVSITLHVYGGEMDHCHIFQPTPSGTYERLERALTYHD